MVGSFEGYLDRFVIGRALRRWRRAADAAEGCDIGTLAVLRRKAKQHRAELDRLLHVAEGRLALPFGGEAGSPSVPGTDWVWRPEFWRGPVPVPGIAGIESRTALCDSVTLFHDCRLSEITTRQILNPGPAGGAPYGLSLDVLHFDGSFLSLVFDLPPDALQGLRTKHLIQMDLVLEMERPVEIFARLNIKHGPNVEQILRELPRSGPQAKVEFDLFYTKLNEKRVEQAWIDLICEGPRHNRIVLHDVMVSRRPRAEL